LSGREDDRLVCPSCGRAHEQGEHFCASCGVPLAYAAALEGHTAQPVSELRRDARRVKPAYTGGKLVRLTTAQNESEGELIQGLLLDAGVPSMLRRSSGPGLPYMPGPCEVLVPKAGLQAAREALVRPEPGERQLDGA
jgi:hypothetical protein